jgi:hypothetical protein
VGCDKQQARDPNKTLHTYSPFLEDTAAEFAVKLLHEKRYMIPWRYCGKRKGGNFDINVAAIFDEACILVAYLQIQGWNLSHAYPTWFKSDYLSSIRGIW